MYTVVTLQEKLEAAKSNLREVESIIFKTDGKPAFNSGARYHSKQNTRQERPPDDNGPPRRRVFDLLGDYNTPGRKRIVEEATQRRRVTDDDLQERRVGKRPFYEKEEGEEEDESPVRKKMFPSVVGRVQLSDLSVTLQRGRQERERQGPNPRSVFSRLSGLAQASRLPEEVFDEDEEIIQKRQPVVPSRVLAVEHPTPSREEVISAEKQDVARKQRDRRMFGALLGTLKQFCREETQVKEKEERRLKIEKKLEDEAVREKERMKEEKQNLQVERRRREADIKRIEWSLNRVKEYAAWEASVVLQQNFIMTKSSPSIFYLPKIHNAATEALLEASAKATQETIAKRLASLNAEIESSEKKALKAAGEMVDDVDKENEDQDHHEDQKPGHQDEDEEETWEESQYEGLQLVEAHEVADQSNVETAVDTAPNTSDDTQATPAAETSVPEEKTPEEQQPDLPEKEQKDAMIVAQESTNAPLIPSELPVEDEAPASDTAPLPTQSPAKHKSPSPSPQTNDHRSRSKSRSPDKKSKKPRGGQKSKSRSPVKPEKRVRKSRSPAKRDVKRSRSRSASRRSKDARARNRSTSRKRSPIRRGRRSGSKSLRRRSRSRSPVRRRPRRSVTPSRRRRSRSNRRSPRRRSPKRDNRRSRSGSPRRRRRSRSSSSSSSSSSSTSGSDSDRKK